MPNDELAERVGAAEAGEQRAMLEASYEAAFGSSVRRDVIAAVDTVEHNAIRASLFLAMLDIGAYESAALTLVPGGYWRNVGQDTDFAWANLTPWGSDQTVEALHWRICLLQTHAANPQKT